jgi:hypothetical protein
MMLMTLWLVGMTAMPSSGEIGPYDRSSRSDLAASLSCRCLMHGLEKSPSPSSVLLSSFQTPISLADNKAVNSCALRRLGRRLKRDGNHVVVADWKKNEFMAESEFCDEFLLVDLRDLGNCIKSVPSSPSTSVSPVPQSVLSVSVSSVEEERVHGRVGVLR